MNGRYVFLLWMVEYLVLLLNCGLPAALNRFLAHQLGRAEAPTLQDMVRLGLWSSLALSSCVAAVTFGVVHLYVLADQANPSLAISLALLAAAQLWTGFAQSILMGLHQFRAYADAVVVSSIVLVIGQTIGAAGWGLGGAIHAALLSYVVGALLLTRAVPWQVSASAAAARLNPNFLPYARDTWLAALISAVVWGRSELFFLELLSSLQESGYFAVGLLLASLVVQSVNLISGALLPHLSRLVGAGETARLSADYRRMTVFIALWTFPASFLGIALAPQLMQVVFGAAYTEAAPAAQWLMATGLLTFAMVGSAVVYAKGDAHIIRNWSLLAAALLITLCTLLAPDLGAVGVAIARLLVQATMITIGFYLLRTRYGLPVPFQPLLQILLAAGASGLAAHFTANLAPGGHIMAIAAGTAVGSLIYLITLRKIGAISAADATVLRALSLRLPPLLGKPVQVLLRIAVS